ncbi:hypothetical protein EXS62_00630 [Candidatus Kaiserbacteria bacterium]|nr:hypothetical protein [Candidatus Kaiserbacteria bacterium]
MRRYIQHIKDTKVPHERRQHAMKISGILTAALFAVWVGTLGVRLASQPEATLTDNSLSAAAANAQVQNGPHLEVSTTSVYSQ